jgi:hypothetical protein
MCVPEHMEHMGCVPLEHTLSCVPNLEHKASCVSKMVDFSNTPRTLPILDLALESVSDGVRLSEAELEERRQELLAKAEIDNGDQEDMNEAAARKLFLLFDKRMKKNQDQRIKYAQKPEKYMNVRTIIFRRLLHFFRAKWIFTRTFTK